MIHKYRPKEIRVILINQKIVPAASHKDVTVEGSVKLHGLSVQ